MLAIEYMIKGLNQGLKQVLAWKNKESGTKRGAFSYKVIKKAENTLTKVGLVTVVLLT